MGLNSVGRTEKVRGQLLAHDLDGLLVSQPENRFYLSGFSGSAGYLLVTSKRAVIATDFRYVEQVGIQCPDYELFRIAGKIEEWFLRLVGEAHVKRLGFESENVTVALAQQMTTLLGKAGVGTEFVPVDGLVESIRIIKEPGELELMRRAVWISDQAIEHVVAWVRPGMTERNVAWEIERFMREHGSQAVPFDLIVASGPNSALPHAQPSEREIRSGEPIVMDIGARVGGYASDITRTICIGKPDATFRKIYDVVLGAQLGALALVREGMTGEAADNLARAIIKEAGHGDAFGHSLGHGVGLAVHESPRLGPNAADILKSGMVFSIEPGVYLPGWGGVRIEDLGVLENGKIQVLSRASKMAE
jgi:Xaa-Pro aminopeptidase